MFTKINYHGAPANQNKGGANVQPPAKQGVSRDASTQNGAASTDAEREAGMRDFIRTIKKFHKAKGPLGSLPKAISEPAIKGIDAEIEKVKKLAYTWVDAQIKAALSDED